jgi:uncharacterized membrane protein YqjE
MAETELERTQEPVAQSLLNVSEKIGRLVFDHVELALAELRKSGRKAALDASLTSAGTAFLGVGWLLLMLSLSYALAPHLGQSPAFFLVAIANLVAGAALLGVFGSRLRHRDRPRLEQTQEELERDRHFLHRAGEILRENRHVPA